MKKSIKEFNSSQPANDKKICDLLACEIDRNLVNAHGKIWHAHPVWFIDENPVVGYSKLKNCIRLMFWSGQSFDEPGLNASGSFKAAEIRFTDMNQINIYDLHRWLSKSEKIQWDYKNIVKRKGKLLRIS